MSEDNPFLKSLPLTEEAVATQADALSDTPATDAVLNAVVEHDDITFSMLAELARRFERELAEANAAAERWYQAASPYATPEVLREALQHLERERAELMDMLRRGIHVHDFIGEHGRPIMWQEKEQARALASRKGAAIMPTIYVSQSDIEAARRIAKRMFPETPDLLASRHVISLAAEIGMKQLRVNWDEHEDQANQYATEASKHNPKEQR